VALTSAPYDVDDVSQRAIRGIQRLRRFFYPPQASLTLLLINDKGSETVSIYHSDHKRTTYCLKTVPRAFLGLRYFCWDRQLLESEWLELQEQVQLIRLELQHAL
jgi:hypothetical protein